MRTRLALSTVLLIPFLLFAGRGIHGLDSPSTQDFYRIVLVLDSTTSSPMFIPEALLDEENRANLNLAPDSALLTDRTRDFERRREAARSVGREIPECDRAGSSSLGTDRDARTLEEILPDRQYGIQGRVRALVPGWFQWRERVVRMAYIEVDDVLFDRSKSLVRGDVVAFELSGGSIQVRGHRVCSDAPLGAQDLAIGEQVIVIADRFSEDPRYALGSFVFRLTEGQALALPSSGLKINTSISLQELRHQLENLSIPGTLMAPWASAERPGWVREDLALDPDGKRASVDRFHSETLTSLTELLSRQTVDGCVPFSEVYDEVVNPPQRGDLLSNLDTAVFAFRGRVLARSGGFQGAIPGTLVRVKPEEIFLKKPGVFESETYFIFLPIGDVQLGQRRICKTDQYFCDLPNVGDEIVVFVPRHWQTATTEFLDIMDQFGMITIHADGRVSFPPSMEAKYPDLHSREALYAAIRRLPAGGS